MSEQAVAQQANVAAAPPPDRSAVLQRQCACGTHTIGGAECESCQKERASAKLQRAATAAEPSGVAPPSVNEVLRSPGQPLDASTRAFFEPRFGRDFSDVRVHTDAQAAHSAQAVNALAYTVGTQVVFGSSQYAPHSPAGRKLLSHELTHVAQGGNTPALTNSPIEIASATSTEERVAELNEITARPATNGVVANRMHLKRAGGSPGGFFANIGRAIASFFTGDEPAYDKDYLKEYLKYLKDNNDIEDDYDSDNKARTVVSLWKAGDVEFELLPATMTLLIKEMLSGATGDDDEIAILDLLENSANGNLRVIFGSGGVNVKELNDAFDGAEWKRLQSFYAARFNGGMSALLAGKVDPIGGPNAGAPTFPYNWLVLKAKIDGPFTVQEIVGDLNAFSESDRAKALKDVGEERVRQQRVFAELATKFQGEKNEPAKEKLKKQALAQRDVVQRLDLILHPVFKDIALTESSATLLGRTKVLTATEKDEAKKVLKPELKTDAAGTVLPFVDKLPGETKYYIDKIRDYMPGMIQFYYDKMVKGRGPEEHKKGHTLQEMEDVGNISKNETDAVFGGYYDTAKHPPLKADKPSKRGSLHDLFADIDKDLKDPKFKKHRRPMAKALLFYFFQTNGGIHSINRDHNADPQFTAEEDPKPVNDEAKALDTLAKEFTKTDKQVETLNHIDRGWDASAGEGEINIQLFRPPVTPDDPPGTTALDKDKEFMWDMFQTLIHEYIHTLVHGDYEKYAKSFGGTQSNQYNTLIEGVDSLLTEIVWSNIEPRVDDPNLRKKVEGALYTEKNWIKVRHASQRRYGSYSQAIKLVNIVGIRNLYAAYFMGETDKIGE